MPGMRSALLWSALVTAACASVDTRRSDVVPEATAAWQEPGFRVRLAADYGRLVPSEDEPAAAEELVREIGFSLMSLELEHGVCLERSACVWGRGEVSEAILNGLHEQCECRVASEDLEALPLVTEGISRRALDGATLDLTPPEWREKEESHRFGRKVWLFSGCFAGVWLAVVLGFLGCVYYQEHKLRGMEAERDTWVPKAEEVSNIRRRVSVVKAYADQEHSSLECLRALALNQPVGVELSSFTYRKSELVKIVGDAATVAQVYDFKNKLD